VAGRVFGWSGGVLWESGGICEISRCINAGGGIRSCEGNRVLSKNVLVEKEQGESGPYVGAVPFESSNGMKNLVLPAGGVPRGYARSR